MTGVERVPREDLDVSRRELLAGTSAVAGAAVTGAVPREVAAQSDPDNEISGTVTDSQGAVQGATVVAVPHDSGLDPLVTTTDANGDYQFSESDLYAGDELYHVIARNGTESDPRRGQENYPFLLANGGMGIPDSGGTHQWDHLEGSGSTLGDSIGSLDGTINGATWVRVVQGYFLDYDGTDDYTNLGSSSTSAFTHFTELGTGTWFAWVNPDSVSGGQLFSGSFATSVRGAGFRFDSGQLDAFLGNGSGTIARATGGSISTDERTPVAVTADGSDLMAWVGDPISQVASDALSNLTAGDWGANVLMGRRGDDNSEHYDGGMGVSFTDDTAWTQSELQGFIDDSRGVYE